MKDHLDEATLNALVDDELDDIGRARAEAHITGCAACAAELTAQRALVRDVAALPRGLAPARDLLEGIHATLDAAPLPLGDVTADDSAAGGRPLRFGDRTVRAVRGSLAAAAVALVALSSAVTALLLRPAEPAFLTADAAGLMPPAEVDRVEARFISATAELERVLRAQRAELAPETIRILEENLAIIDAAIAEARAALRTDPGNPSLSEMLLATYEKKLDLLRSAAASVVT